MNKLIGLCILVCSMTVLAQKSINLKDSNLDEATIKELRNSGLSEDMIEQLKSQLSKKASKQTSLNQSQLNAFFSEYSIHESQHYHLWYPENYQPGKDIKALDLAQNTFIAAFSHPRQTLHVVLFNQPEEMAYTTWNGFNGLNVMPFFTASSSQKQTSFSSTKAIGHEACHMFLKDLPEDEISSEKITYGHPKIPDWFDEAVAVSCEGEALKAKRSERFDLRKIDPSFKSFFAQDHPLLAGLSGALSDSRAEPVNKESNNNTRIIRLSSANKETSEKFDEAKDFYAIAHKVGEWINRNSPDSWHKLLKHYMAGGDSSYQTLIDQDLLNITAADIKP